MTALWIECAGVTFAKVTPRKPSPAECQFCGKAIRPLASRYRTGKWGPSGTDTAVAHGRCLEGFNDPTIYDIKIG